LRFSIRNPQSEIHNPKSAIEMVNSGDSPSTGKSQKLEELRSMIRYLVEIGACLFAWNLLEGFVHAFPRTWRFPAQIVLPFGLVLVTRRWAGGNWTLRNLGMKFPKYEGWAEGFWLVCFHSTYVLAILLLLARFRYYYLLDFLSRYNRALTGASSSYEVFAFGIAAYSLGQLAFGGEVFHRGYVQGLGTEVFSPVAGAFVSWLSFGAFYATEAARLGYRVWPHAWIWAALALFPGPLFESHYFRHGSLIPLIIIRFIGGFLPFALAAFFWYWYPERSFIISMPFLWGGLLLLGLATITQIRRVYSICATCALIVKAGWPRGLAPGLGISLCMLSAAWIPNTLMKTAVLLAALACLRLRSLQRHQRKK